MTDRTPQINIYAPDGSVRLTAHIGKGSTRKYQLMQRDEVELKFTIADAVMLHVGDYIQLEDVGRFELTRAFKPEQNRTSRGYDYTLTFQAQYYKFRNKILKFLPGVGMAETSWSYTDTLDKHAAHILANMNYIAYGSVFPSRLTTPDGTQGLQPDPLPTPQNPSYLHNGVSQWLGAVDETVENKAVSISYDKKNIIDAITDLANAYEVEWWFEDNILHFGKRQYDNTPIDLVFGDNVTSISRSNTKESEATRLYIYGSDRNVASTYRKRLIFHADHLTEKAGGKALVRDDQRDLKPRWFPEDKLTRKPGSNALVQFPLSSTVPVPKSKKSNDYRTCNIVLTPDVRTTAVTPGTFDVLASAIKPTLRIVGNKFAVVRNVSVYIHYNDNYTMKEGNMSGKIEASLDKDFLDSDFSDWVWVGEQDYRPVGEWRFTFEDKLGFQVQPGVTSLSFSVHCVLDVAAGFVDDIEVELSLYGSQDFHGNNLQLVNVNPEYSVNNLTVNILDSDTGEVRDSIEGCTLAPDFETEKIPILLSEDIYDEAGNLKISQGDLFELPDIYSALVPASYFTNKYTVADQFSDLVTTGIISRRLMLPETNPDTGEPQPSYIDVVPPESVEEAIEDVKVFEDIYPSNTSTIMEVFTDPKDEEITEQDGSITYRPWTSYRFKDDFFKDDHPFNLSLYKIDGKELEITFQGVKRYETEDEIPQEEKDRGKHKGDIVYDDVNGGRLSGMTFKVAYVEEDGGTFEIQRDQTTLLPNDIIYPQKGDTFILSGFNIAMLSDPGCDFIKNAEQRLYYKAREYADKLNTDASVYNCTIGCDYAAEYLSKRDNDLCFDMGTAVNIVHSPYFFEQSRISRIIGFEIHLDQPEDNPVYIVGEKAQYNKFGEIKSSIDSLQIIAGSLSDGSMGSGGMANIITTTSATDPTDANVYSALRTDKEIANKALSRLTEDTAQGRITFSQGLKSDAPAYLAGGAKFGDTCIEGLLAGSGASIDVLGNAEVESLKVRSSLEVYQLIYNRLNATEGNTSFADSGTVDLALTGTDPDTGELSDNVQMLTMHRRFDGDFTPFQYGDVIYGYVNDLETSGQYHKAWGRVLDVDRTENIVKVLLYPAEECPSGENHGFRENMVVSRWGNAIEPTAETAANPDYSFITVQGDRYVNTRQTTFYISTEDGNIIELMGVYKPIIDGTNYATVIGRIPSGLLDEDTEELLNKAQPYIYARGLIVQDLIQIDYNGVRIRTQNYRGEWAAGQTYHSGDYSYDTVTYGGVLWQCLVAETVEEPSALSSAWLAMTDKTPEITIDIFKIIPNTSVVTLRHNDDGTTSINPSQVTCKVLLTNVEGRETYVGGYDLLERGVTLYYSLDGLTWMEFVVGEQEPLELEDGTDVLVTEDSDETSIDVLTVGGDDITVSRLGDKIWFELRDTEANVLARQTIPVVLVGRDGDSPVNVTLTPENLALVEPGLYHVTIEVWQGSERLPMYSGISGIPGYTYIQPWGSDCRVEGIDSIAWSAEYSDNQLKFSMAYSGEPVEATVTVKVVVYPDGVTPVTIEKQLHLVSPKSGEEGKAGLMVYPAGEYDPQTEYSSEGDTAPVVLYNSHYFVLNRGCRYLGTEEEDYDTPAEDSANNANPRWRLMTQFNSIFADIIMAEFAKLGKAVFYGDWMISQRGNLVGQTESTGTYDGAVSSFTATYLLALAGQQPELPPAEDNTLVDLDYTAYDEAGSVLDTFGLLTFNDGGTALVPLTPRHQHVTAVAWRFAATATAEDTPSQWYNTPCSTAENPCLHIKATVETAEKSYDGPESDNYSLFKQDGISPKLSINFASGKLRARDAEISGNVTADTLSLGMETVYSGMLLTHAFNVVDISNTTKAVVFGLPELAVGTSRSMELLVKSKSQYASSQVTFMKENDTDNVKVIYLGKSYGSDDRKTLTSSGGLYRLTGWCSPEDAFTYWNITVVDTVEPETPETLEPINRPIGGFVTKVD